jgi:transposase
MSNSERIEQLSRRQRAAIFALLEHPTTREAARVAGVGESTLRRWLVSDEAFRAALADAQHRATEAAFGRLASRSERAVETLEKNLSSGAAGVEVRAALGWLSLLHKRGESSRYARMEQEIERLASLVETQDADRRAEL